MTAKASPFQKLKFPKPPKEALGQKPSLENDMKMQSIIQSADLIENPKLSKPKYKMITFQILPDLNKRLDVYTASLGTGTDGKKIKKQDVLQKIIGDFLDSRS